MSKIKLSTLHAIAEGLKEIKKEAMMDEAIAIAELASPQGKCDGTCKKGLFRRTHFHFALPEPQIPDCLNCGKPMIAQVDKLTGKLSPYLWRCSCMPEGVELCILKQDGKETMVEPQDLVGSDQKAIKDWEIEFEMITQDSRRSAIETYQLPQWRREKSLLKALISKVEAEAFERGRKMKGSSFREGYDSAMRELKADAEHEQ